MTMINYTKEHNWSLVPIIEDETSILVRAPQDITIKPNKIQHIYLGLKFQIPENFIFFIEPFENNDLPWKILLNYAYPSIYNFELSHLPVICQKLSFIFAGDIICRFRIKPTNALLSGKLIKNI